MDTLGDSECDTSIPPLCLSSVRFLNAQSSAGSMVDLDGLLDPDLFGFDDRVADGKDVVPKEFYSVPSYTTNLSPDSPNPIPLLAGVNSSQLSQSDDFRGSTNQHSCQNPRGHCISLATGLLKSMHATSPACLLGTANQDHQLKVPPRPVDVVLSMNQGALQVMRDLRACSCYETPQLQLLITAICAEAIAWYRRIIYAYSQGHGSSIDGDNPYTNRVETRRQSFSIGEHCLEGRLETQLISQVLSSRLQELDNFIGDVGRNRTNEECPDIEGEAGSYASLRGVHIRMGTFLNSQMRGVRSDLVNLQDGTAAAEETRHEAERKKVGTTLNFGGT
ncbi:hypothetical protein F5X97DRAFT_307840 [Nemania serpens]|nr:hypothetical protein F5X97DRAFT_307840 [Nemania serpens]